MNAKKSLMAIFIVIIMMATPLSALFSDIGAIETDVNDGLENYASNADFSVGVLKYKITDKNEVAVVGVDMGICGVTVPSNVEHDGETYSVTSIGDEVFTGRYGISNISLPDTLKSIGYRAFYNTSLSSIDIPGSVVTIGDEAFNQSASLASITLNEGIEQIGDKAFNTCRVPSITIPASIKSIGSNAFANCGYLTNVTIPDTLKDIPNGMFNMCTMLTTFNIPEGIESIGDGAFERTRLKNIRLPASLETIGVDAFPDDCEITTTEGGHFTTDEDGILYRGTELVRCPDTIVGDYIVKDNVTVIGENAFRPATELTEVTIPEGVTTIDSGAFLSNEIKNVRIPTTVAYIHGEAFPGDCKFDLAPGGKFTTDENGVLYQGTKLIRCPTTVSGQFEIPSTVTEIGPLAFSGCNGITGIVYPVSVTIIGEGAFFSCVNLKTFEMQQGNDAIKQQNNANVIELPTELTDIAPSAFCNCKELQGELTIPNKVTNIREQAFENTKISKVTIPGNVKTIGDSAFYGCHLTEIALDTGIEKIGVAAFEKSYLNEINIPSTVTEIGLEAFKDCYFLTSVSIPDGIKIIHERTFHQCENLETVIFDEGVEKIDTLAFYKCTALQNIELPNTLKIIGSSAFSYSGLKTVKFGNNLEQIGDAGFDSCKGFESITIPSSVKQIDPYAFYNCTNLGTVNLSEGLISIDDLAFSNTALTTVTIPSTVTHLGGRAFSAECNCELAPGSRMTVDGKGVIYNETKLVWCPDNITQFTIPDSVDDIGNMAFMNCERLTTIEIPSTVKRIGQQAFANTGIKTVCIPSTVEILYKSAFDYRNLESLTIGACVHVYDSTFGPTSFYREDGDQYIKLSLTEIPGHEFVYKNIPRTVAGFVMTEKKIASTITYDPNGGTGGPTSDFIDIGAEYTVSFSPIPEMPDYNFMGWSATKDATVPDYTESGKHTMVVSENDVTLYAVWEIVPVPEPYEKEIKSGDEFYVTIPTSKPVLCVYLCKLGEEKILLDEEDYDVRIVTTEEGTFTTIVFDSKLTERVGDYEFEIDLLDEKPIIGDFKVVSSDEESNLPILASVFAVVIAFILILAAIFRINS